MTAGSECGLLEIDTKTFYRYEHVVGPGLFSLPHVLILAGLYFRRFPFDKSLFG